MHEGRFLNRAVCRLFLCIPWRLWRWFQVVLVPLLVVVPVTFFLSVTVHCTILPRLQKGARASSRLPLSGQ
jgi:hypothetical protein